MEHVKPDVEAFAKIKVIGVGGGGSNAIQRMIDTGIQGVDFISINTDAQDLHHSEATHKVHLGKNLTRGLGAGMDPEIGRKASEESKEEIYQAVSGAHMVFITCGLGGGTGSGASPIIAEVAREAGALTVAVVTKPFTFEGIQRKKIAEDSYQRLKKHVDTIITIPNDKILNIVDQNTPITEAFAIVDDVLRQGVQGISDLITTPGLVNVDFADVSAVMSNAGSALMGIGSAKGEGRATTAARTAINSPLLDLAIEGARGVLFNISGGSDLSMAEMNEAANVITESIDEEAKVIFGTVVDESLEEGRLKVTVIATGFDQPEHAVQALASMKAQLNELYGEKEAVEHSATDADFDVNGDTFDQLQALMAREEKLQRELGVSSPDAVVKIVEGLTDQLEDLYQERDADSSTESFFALASEEPSPLEKFEEELGTSDPDAILEMVEGLSEQLTELYEGQEQLAAVNVNGAQNAAEMVKSMQHQLESLYERQETLSERGIDGMGEAITMIESMEAQLNALYDDRYRLAEAGVDSGSEALSRIRDLEARLDALADWSAGMPCSRSSMPWRRSSG